MEKIEKKNSQLSTPSIKVQTIEGETIRFPLENGLNFIGRKSALSENQDVTIAITTKDTKISRKHCCIRMEEINTKVGLMLFDTESSNGTFLKSFHNSPLSEYDVIYLKHNDQITIGETKLVIEIPLSMSTLDVKVETPTIDKTKTVLWSVKK